MNVQFKLDGKQHEKLILLICYFSGIRFSYSTKENILPENWNNETMRPSLDKELPKHIIAANKIIKNVLDRYENTFLEIIGDLKREASEVSVEAIRTEMNSRLNTRLKSIKVKRSKNKISDFYELADIFIADSKSGKRVTRKGTIISARRIQKYEALKTMLKDWKPIININDINMDFYSQLIAYRNEEKKAINTIGMDIKVLKTMLHYTYEKGLHQNNIHTKDDFRAFEEISEHIYLNDKELNKLWLLKKLSKKHELVRDVFIIGCYTSLRISDLGVLEEFNIIQGQSGQLLKIIQHKGDEPVFIPIHKRVRMLLKKYGGKFPKAYSEQKMNEYIRKVCEIAKINEQQQFKITRGGKVERFVKEKWQMVTNHTARRSFATNLIIAGFNPLAVMKITGHKTMKDFMRYVCVTQHEMANTMSVHKYFR